MHSSQVVADLPAGHSVIAAMRGVNGKNTAAAKELGALPNVEVVEMDVTSEQSVNAAIQQTLKQHGRIDVLINNAGVAGFGLLEATSIDQIKRIFEVNLFGVIRTYQIAWTFPNGNRQQGSGLWSRQARGPGFLWSGGAAGSGNI